MSRPRRPPQTPTPSPGEVRIIGGQLRGSRLPVPDLPGLRPSSDRMRETLFNWLMFDLPGRACLDLFAGSGALGFEAASRGAAPVLLVERDPQAAALLRASAERLKAQVEVHAGDAIAFLQTPPRRRFDLVFVDPPFASELQAAALAALPPHLSERAFIYVESPPGPAPTVLADWSLHRELATRQAHGRLYRRRGAEKPSAD
jgi:16S rRNA (guanine966-N2)-methyltransferase